MDAGWPVVVIAAAVSAELSAAGSDHFLARVRRAEDFRLGTFAPARRASDSPMAMACLRLLTFAPERPLRSVPRLRSCIALSTLR